MDLEERISECLRRRASTVRPDVAAARSEIEGRLRRTPTRSGKARRIGSISFALLLSSLALFGLWRSFGYGRSGLPVASGSQGALTVDATIDTSQNLSGIAAGAEGVWVVGMDTTGDSTPCAGLVGRAERIDPTSDKVVQSIQLSLFPTRVGVGFGSVWVGGYTCAPPTSEGKEASFVATVARLDPLDGSIEATISLPGPEVNGLAVGPTSVWVTWGDPTGSTGSLDQIDPGTNTVVQSVTFKASVRDPIVGEGFVWVWQPSSATILRVSPQTLIVDDVAVQAAGPAVAGDGVIWIPTTIQLSSPGPTGYEVPAIARVNPATNVMIGSPVSAGLTTGETLFRPFGVGDGSLWFLSGGDGVVTVSKLDATTLTVTQSVRAANGDAWEPVLDLSNNSVWLADQNQIQGAVLRLGY